MDSDSIQKVQLQGLAQPGINGNEYAQLPIPRPPLSEQRAIAEALGNVDALLGALDRLIAKKRDLKQAAMQQLLTGQTRLPSFHGEWGVKRLGDVLKVRHGRSQRHIVAQGGRYPILATSGEIGRTNYYLYDKPSVLIGRKGTIDSPQYVETPFWTIDALFFKEIASDASAKFIFYKFTSINWRSYNEASGVPSLNASTIESIEVRLPKRDEQVSIIMTSEYHGYYPGKRIILGFSGRARTKLHRKLRIRGTRFRPASMRREGNALLGFIGNHTSSMVSRSRVTQASIGRGK